MELNYRHSLKSMNRELSKHEMRFTCVGENHNQSNRTCITYILKEINTETGRMTQTCGYYYSASDAVEFINKLNNRKG